MSRKYFIYFSIIYIILILAVSSIPGVRIPKVEIFGFDKLLHIVEYILLAFLLTNSLKNPNIKAILIIVIIGSSYGVLNEIWQIYIAGRCGSIYDGIANGIGMIIGSLVTYKYLLFSHD